MKILISGAVPGEEDALGVKAVLVVLDTDTGALQTLFEYLPPKRLDGRQNVQFTGYSFKDDYFYLCAFNEILAFQGFPLTDPVARISDPGFNDLHHCMPWRDGLAVANTGLETVDHVGLDGELKQRWDLLEGIPGARTIDPSIDYRLLPDTKPHLVHANHVFAMGNEIWATQLRTSRAVCVTGSAEEIPMEVGMPHDGIQFGAERVFTTVNGNLVFADSQTGSVKKRVNLVEMTPDLEQIGWCRGVCRDPRDENRFFVSFTKARRTKWKEIGHWIKHRHTNPQSRVCLYDLSRKELCDSWLIGDDPGLILFQLAILEK